MRLENKSNPFCKHGYSSIHIYQFKEYFDVSFVPIQDSFMVSYQKINLLLSGSHFEALNSHQSKINSKTTGKNAK